MALTRFYAFRCIYAEWRTTISSREDMHALDGQKFLWEVEALKQVPLFDTRTIRLVSIPCTLGKVHS